MSINPSHAPGYVPASDATYVPPPAAPPAQRGRAGMGVKILSVAVIALLAANGYLFYQLDKVRKDLTSYHDTTLSEFDRIREASAVSSQSHRRTVEALRDQLETARRQANMAAGQARTDALRKVEETKQQLVAAQQASTAQVNSAISEVRQTADTANTKLAEVGTEVTTVKTDVAKTKSDLEKTIADLKRTNGDLNGQGVLVATNGKELQALRALGERNYVEFSVHKAKQRQRVGDVMVQLKKADPKHNRYTIELTADDKTVEKKDRTTNEPLQFMVPSKSRQPYEIVVNDVKKDQITGYLAVPKVQKGRSE